MEWKEMKQVQVELKDSKRVTCRQAVKLLNEGKVWKVYFRPDGFLSHAKDANHNNDPAYVWMK